MRSAAFAAFAVIAAMGIAPADVVVVGVASDCALVPSGFDVMPVPQHEVLIFDSAKVLPLVAALRKLGQDDPFTHQETLDESVALYSRIMEMTRKMPQIATAKTDNKGRFKTRVPRVDNLLVFSFDNMIEGRPLFYGFREVEVRGRDTVAFELDFCGYCKKAREAGGPSKKAK